MSNRDWWEQWGECPVANKWDGDMKTTTEEMYQAFKARMIEEMDTTQEQIVCPRCRWYFKPEESM